MSVTIDRKQLERKVALEEPDYQYYNIRIYSSTINPKLVPAKYKENRTVPILDKPSDYELSVARFSIPASIPIFLWPQVQVDGKKTGAPSTTVYRCTLQYNGTIAFRFAQFVNNCIGCAYPLGVYSYQQFLDAINLAYADAFTELKGLEPGMPPTEAPFLALDRATQLISLYAQQSYATPGDDTKIYMGSTLYDTYFPSLQAIVDVTGSPITAINIVVADTKTNSITYGGSPYYQMTQEFPTLALWNEFVSLVIESDTIPIEPEYQPAQTNVTRRIVTDFEPQTAINDRQAFQFFPQGPLRYYDLKSNYPMRSIDATVYLQAKDGDTYLLYLAPGQYMSLKLQFRKKRSLLLQDALDIDGFT